MKLITRLLALTLLIVGLHATQKDEIEPCAILFEDDYKPSDKLAHLLDLLGMPSSETSLSQINRWAQTNLLRSGERWDQQVDTYEALRPKIYPLLKELGFIDTKLPQLKSYEGAIVHGSLLSNVRLRLQFLADQWEAGVRFKDLYFLGGERPLLTNRENKETFIQAQTPFYIRSDWALPATLPTTECEMMMLVWNQAEVPKEMRETVRVHFINAPMKTDPKNGKHIRPNTDDTAQCWVQANPLPGHYLAISNAPYTNRQDIVMKRNSPSCYHFDTVGFGCHSEQKMAIILDELARFIYQTQRP